MMTLIKADELAKDMSGANALLQRHNERKVYSIRDEWMKEYDEWMRNDWINEWMIE